MAEGRAQIIPCQAIHGPGISNWGGWDPGPATRQTDRAQPLEESTTCKSEVGTVYLLVNFHSDQPKKGSRMRTLVLYFCECFAYYLCSQPCARMCVMCLLGMHAAAGILPLSGFWILHNTFSCDKLNIFSKAC